MSPILNRNAILTGHVDSFCLACEAHLRGDEDAVQHVLKPVHRKNLEATGFLDKFKDDHVRKVKKGYYCEYCNVFMKTAAKVGPHVAEPKHSERKASQPLKREGTGVLAFDKVFIPENAWHGLTEDTCAVCDAEFDNASLHKTETAHILNLVLAEIEIADGNVFRKVDDSTFQCLTCNLVSAQNDMSAHFDGDDHKKLYQERSDAAKNIANEPKKEPETAKTDTQSKKPEIDTPKTETPKVDTENEVSKEEKAKKAPEVVNAKANESKKKSESENKADTEKKPDPKKDKAAATNPANLDKMGKTDKEICEVLGAVNYIATDVNGKNWCILCDWAMDQSAVQPHLKSKHHHKLLKMHRERAAKRNPGDEEPANNNDEPKINGNIEEVPKVNTEHKENKADQKAEDKSKIVDAASEFQKNEIKLDLINSSAFCRVCSKNVDYDFDTIKNHIDGHKKAKPVKAHKTENLKSFANSSEKTALALVSSPVHMNGKDKPKQEKDKAPKQEKDNAAPNKEMDEAENYAKENNLVRNKERNTAFCPVCLTKVPPALKNMKEHINGVSHKNKVAQKTEPIKTKKTEPILNVIITKEPTEVFIDEALTIENVFHKDVVINNKYCLNVASFFMITRIGPKFRCQGCEVNLAASQVDDHKRSLRHEKNMNESPVVTSEPSEFIREVRPDVYHCGYCNQVAAPWATMESHLRCTAHREAKTAATWRLQGYAADLAFHRARERQTVMQFALFHRMFMAQMFGED